MFNRHLKEKINYFEKVSVGFNLFKEDKNKQTKGPSTTRQDNENPLHDKLWIETFFGCLF